MSTRQARTADKSTNDKHTRILKALLQKPGNKFCVDCRKKGMSANNSQLVDTSPYFFVMPVYSSSQVIIIIFTSLLTSALYRSFFPLFCFAMGCLC